MKKMVTFFAFICLILLSSCDFFRKQTGYPDKIDYCEYYVDPNSHVHAGCYGITYVVDGDTVRGIVDTGASATTVTGKHFLERRDLLPKRPARNANDSIMQWHRLKVKDFSWGNVHFYDMYVYVDDGGNRAGGDGGLLGRDILRGSIVQFDHESNLIKLSRNEEKLKGRGQIISARFDEEDKVFVPIMLPNGETLEFLLDTGFGGELRLGSKSYKGNYAFREPLIWKELDTSRKPKGGHLSLCDITFGGKVYPNSRLLLSNTESNLLGAQFLKRFKSFTIDYINKKLYVEYPDRYTLRSVGDINFEKDTIGAIPLEYIASIFQDYNTYGFEIERRDSLFVITHVEKALERKGIKLGDTLVGMNNHLFDAKYLDELNDMPKVDMPGPKRTGC